MPTMLQAFMSAFTQSDHVFLGLPRAFEHGTYLCILKISSNSFTQKLRYELQKIGFAKNFAFISRKIATLFKLEKLEKQGHRV